MVVIGVICILGALFFLSYVDISLIVLIPSIILCVIAYKCFKTAKKNRGSKKVVKQAVTIEKAVNNELPKKSAEKSEELNNNIEIVESRDIKAILRKRKATIIAAASCAVVALLVFLVVLPNVNYNKGVEKYNNQNYEEAIPYLEKSNGIKDSKKILSECYYVTAMKYYDDCKYNKAAHRFYKAGAYQDARILYNYSKGIYLYNKNEYGKAYSYFEKCKEFSNSSELGNISRLIYANELIEAGNCSKAIKVLSSVPVGFTYNGLDCNSLRDKANFVMGDNAVRDENFDYANSCYGLVSQGYSYNGSTVADRMALINDYSAMLSWEGTHKLLSGTISIWPNGSNITPWKHYDLSGSMTIEVSISSAMLIVINVNANAIEEKYEGAKNDAVSFRKSYRCELKSYSNAINFSETASLTVSDSGFRLFDRYLNTADELRSDYVFENDITYSR